MEEIDGLMIEISRYSWALRSQGPFIDSNRPSQQFGGFRIAMAGLTDQCQILQHTCKIGCASDAVALVDQRRSFKQRPGIPVSFHFHIQLAKVIQQTSNSAVIRPKRALQDGKYLLKLPFSIFESLAFLCHERKVCQYMGVSGT